MSKTKAAEPQYVDIDAAILKAVKAGKGDKVTFANIRYNRDVSVALDESKLANPDRVVDRRLQALRKQDQVHFNGGWHAGPGKTS